MNPRYLLGLDVGGTKIAAAVADAATGVVLAEMVAPSSRGGGDQLLAAIERAVAAALGLARVDRTEMLSVGVGVPGHVNHDRGVVHLAVNLKLAEYPLGQVLAARLGTPVVVENDVRLGALGVFQLLCQEGEAPQSLAYVGIGTGIAAGILLDGVLQRGANGLAGEIGHMIVEPGGSRCHCGLNGCLETVAAGPAIARAGHGRVAGAQTTADVYRAAATGNSVAEQIVARASRFLAQALYGLLLATDVEMVVLGGGVAGAGDAFLEPLLAALATLADSSALAATLLAPERFRLLPPDRYPGTRGALVLAGELAGNNKPFMPSGGGNS